MGLLVIVLNSVLALFVQFTVFLGVLSIYFLCHFLLILPS